MAPLHVEWAENVGLLENSMQLTDRIQQHFGLSIEAITTSADTLIEPIAHAASSIAECLLSEGKVLTCGNGASSAVAMSFSSQLLNRFERERPSLPVMTLSADTATVTAIADDYSFNDIFSKQIRALGNPQDILLAITSDGQPANVVQAVQAAHDRQMRVITLSGKDGGDVALLLAPEDIELRVPVESPSHILEVHLLITHCLCDLLDAQLFG